MELDLGTIITLIITAAGTFFGGAWLFIKNKLTKVVKLGKSALDVAETLESALADDKITTEEIAAIKKELAEVKVAWKDLINKKDE